MYYLDILRIISICLVIFGHTENYGYMLFTFEAKGSLLYWIYITFSLLCPLCIPILFMISGVTLLKKEESFKELFKKRILKFLLILIVFSLLMYIYDLNFNFNKFSISNFLKTLYSSNIVPSYWYLYSYLSFLIFLPILRKIVKKLKTKDYMYIICIFLFIRLLNIFEFIVWKEEFFINKQFSTFFINANFVYPLIGYFLEYKLPKKYYNKKNLIILIIISIICMSTNILLTHFHCVLINEWVLATCRKFFNTLIIIPSITLFFGIKLFFQNKKANKFICTLSSCTFGIYLIERACRKETGIIVKFLIPYLGKLPACLVWIFFVLFIAFAIIYILKKIPILKKLI